MRQTYFKLFGDNCMEIITTGQIFLLNYELSRFSKKPGNSPWDISSNQNLNYRQNFELYSFELTRFYYARFKSVSQEHIRCSCPPTRFESVVNEVRNYLQNLYPTNWNEPFHSSQTKNFA
jgi:hypothetical protein